MGRGKRTITQTTAENAELWPALPRASAFSTPMITEDLSLREIVRRRYSDLVSIDEVQEGQMGRDLEGEDFQLLEIDTHRVRLLHLGQGRELWVPRDEVFLRKDSISFPPMPREQFSDPYRELLEMVGEGRFDRWEEDGSSNVFRIGNWVLRDGRAMEFRSCRAADDFLQECALDARARQEAVSFRPGSLEDPFEEACEGICIYLARGEGDVRRHLRNLQEYSGEENVQVFVERMNNLPDTLPEPIHEDFVRIIPLWREVQRFRVRRRSHLLLQSMRSSKSV